MSTKHNRVTRREAIKTGAAGVVAAAAFGFPSVVPSRVLGKDGAVAPSNRIVMGCIGMGGQGNFNMMRFAGFPEVQVVALCDVEQESNHYLGGATHGLKPSLARIEKHYSDKNAQGAEHKGIQGYSDLRELLAREDIDAVTICTPDHWHATAAVLAANAKKHMYCEKPLANSVREGRAIVQAVKKNKVVLQTGTQERSGDNARLACELVINGYLGRIKQVTVNLPDEDSHHVQVRQMQHEPVPEQPVPATLDWDRWLGPSPSVPYHRNRSHFYWRFILAHGGGEMTDRGAHVIDIAQLGLGMDHTGPVEISAKGRREAGPGPFNVFWDYEFECLYPNGMRMVGNDQGERGLKFEGENGWVFVHIHGGKLEASDPQLLQTDPKDFKIHLGRSPGHHRNFLDVVMGKDGAKLIAPAEVGHRTGSICHLANIAMATGRKITWDPDDEQIKGDDEASKMLGPTMREPWAV
ncbi:MAG TPA: Gfo/Idh/MocA family oxidoreductase [Tepidisphaeraceae bacterium]|nr:Gfo/Idh/MocA family oxidoreductase [Tepidisphaeraceae bacterium]